MEGSSKGARAEVMAGSWLPAGKSCAVCFSVDDVHPGRSSDAYEAGGDLENGSLGLVCDLLERQPVLKSTLFVTPDWRQISPFPTRKALARIPFLRDRVNLTRRLRPGTMSLERHQSFVRFLLGIPRTEVALHGLHHTHVGRLAHVEFQEQSVDECRRLLAKAQEIFCSAGLGRAAGIQPPAWNTPSALVEACETEGLYYVCGARDVNTPVSKGARTAMSGPMGLSLIYPQEFPGAKVVHIATNFQATSRPERAMKILSLGGLLSIKAHIVKRAGSYVALDGVDELYCNYLELLIERIRSEYGSSVWFATMSEIANAFRGAR